VAAYVHTGTFYWRTGWSSGARSLSRFPTSYQGEGLDHRKLSGTIAPLRSGDELPPQTGMLKATNVRFHMRWARLNPTIGRTYAEEYHEGQKRYMRIKGNYDNITGS